MNNKDLHQFSADTAGAMDHREGWYVCVCVCEVERERERERERESRKSVLSAQLYDANENYVQQQLNLLNRDQNQLGYHKFQLILNLNHK